jgi:valyl-tRNA synthetase
LESYLRLLHPFMPFISEEIWQSIPHKGKSIMISQYPEYKPVEIDKEAEYEMGILMDVISAIRKFRSQLYLSPQKRFPVYLITDHLEKKSLLIKNIEKFMKLAGLSSVDFVSKIDDLANYSKSIASGINIFIPLIELIDKDKELVRLNNRLGEVKERYERSLNKISNEKFLKKAPNKVVLRERENLKKFKKEIVSIEEQISILKGKK